MVMTMTKVLLPDEPKYRWYVLGLGALTNTLTVAIPSMCLPVLFKEISGELNLTLVQIGLIWGIGALPGVFMTLVGGIIGDRFGPKRILSAACLLVGLVGALRGLSFDFISLTVTVFLYGMLSSMIPMNVFKTCSLWFSRQQLGLANGVLSMGMALGFMVGSMISATLLSPWLGGWRNVLFLYGALAITLTIPWLLLRTTPAAGSLAGSRRPQSMGKTIRQVARVKNIWLLGLTILGVGGCVQATLGYLPLYLRGLDWPAASADGAAAAFHTVSMIFVVPIALWSDKIGSRRKVLLATTLMIALGVGLLSIVDGILVWVAIIMAGMVRDGFMAVFMTMIIETEGIGTAYAGTATGLAMVFGGVGSLVAPPLGNSLAAMAPGLPFVFWAALTGAGFLGLYLAKETD